MFSIKSSIYLNIIFTLSITVAQNKHDQHDLHQFHDDNDPIIDPLELVLKSTDKQGIFYCNGRLEINNQQNRLVASIDKTISTSPIFQLNTEQANSTTIRIHISPNGYIGINRISCHWDNNVTYGQTADLIIGEKPGVIQLKESCRAYDRRYVECIFRAPIIARAFRNGFPRLYSFSEIDHDILSYHNPPSLVNITDDNELVFHFQPRDRNVIPKKIPMSVNMTLSRFGSSTYRFNMEPVHTTKVDFRIENQSHKHLVIHINHNNTGVLDQRLCAGHVSQVDDQKMFIAVQDIRETSDHKISIDRLSSSSKYLICLKCYYQPTDKSFKEEKCISASTTSKPPSIIWYSIIAVIIIAIALLIGGMVYYKKWRTIPTTPKSARRSNGSIIVPIPDDEIEDLSPTSSRELRYTTDPIETDRFIPPSLPGSLSDSQTRSRTSLNNTHDGDIDRADDRRYQSMTNMLQDLDNKQKVSQDTYEL